ncbi:MAG: hypothetical protein K940chlam2_00776 [Chlamydiae bacterium]|nr:hypothetical protein [Chlamydiota bacterium]
MMSLAWLVVPILGGVMGAIDPHLYYYVSGFFMACALLVLLLKRRAEQATLAAYCSNVSILNSEQVLENYLASKDTKASYSTGSPASFLSSPLNLF